jgi:hypothetical protein
VGKTYFFFGGGGEGGYRFQNKFDSWSPTTAPAVPSNTYLMLHHVSDWTDGWGERLLRHHGTCWLGHLLVFLTFNIFYAFFLPRGFFSMYGCFIHVANAAVDSQEQYGNIFPLMGTGSTDRKGIFQVKLTSRKLSGTV